MTVFINQTAEFTCGVHRPFSYQYWRVNGTDLNRLPSDIRDDVVITQNTVGDNEVFILTITARAEYNGTRVQCVTGGGGDERESENATLNIQGINCNTCTCTCSYTVCIIHVYMYLYTCIFMCHKHHSSQVLFLGSPTVKTQQQNVRLSFTI